MKICFIGNSHLAAVKHGFDQIARQDPVKDLDVTFFGAPSTSLKHLRYADGKLFAGNEALRQRLQKISNGLSEIELAPYDLMVVLGGQLHVTTALNLFAQYRPVSLIRDGSELISESAFEGTLDDLFELATATHVLKLIAPAHKRTLIVPAPLRNELVVGQGEYAYLQDKSYARDAVDWIVGACRRSWAKIALKFDADLLDQPAQSIGEVGLTKAEFAGRRTFRDNQWFDEPDTIHANEAYGALLFKHFRSYLRESGARAEAT